MPKLHRRKTVAYLRLSTLEQAQGQALEQQAARLRAAGVDEIYCDIESGNNSNRPELTRMIDEICEGKIGVVKATRWDRLYRNKLDYEYFKVFLRQFKVDVELLDQGKQDLSTASGEMSADMLVLLAAFERNMLGERVKHGFAHRRTKGVAWIRPPSLYEIVDDKYYIDRRPIVCSLQDQPANYKDFSEQTPIELLLSGQSKADIAREIIECFLSAKTYRGTMVYIHQRYTTERYRTPSAVPGLALFSHAESLKTWLMNPVLRGHTAYLKYSDRRSLSDPSTWELHKDTHPEHKVMTDEVYESEIKPLLERNSRKGGKSKTNSLLTKKVVCNRCKAFCQLTSGSGNRQYYVCPHKGITCDNRVGTRIEKIEESIIFALTERAIELKEHQGNAASKELLKLQRKLEAIDQVLEDEFDQDLVKKREKVLFEIARESDRTNYSGLQMLQCPQSRKINFWYSLSREDRESAYLRLLNRVFIEGDSITVDLKV